MDAGTELGAQSIWPSIYPELLRLVQAHRSTIVFVNNRRLAERLALRLNELANEGNDGPRHDIARAHHGSLAREQRVLVEEELKAGRIPCLVATSSLELGIDMGAVDLVIQVESPKSVARGLQRIGRAGHELGAVSKGRIFPKFRADLLESAVVARAMREGAIEETRIPTNPLDVLAQQVVAISADAEIASQEVFELVTRAYPFRDLSRAQFDNVLDMLAGRYPSDEFAELRPRIVWDRTNGTIRARDGARRLAVTNAGTIPDRGLVSVSSTRKWSTRRAPARRSCSARRPGASKRSRATAFSCRRRPGCPVPCRSGRARASDVRTSSGRRSELLRASWSGWTTQSRCRAFAMTSISTSALRRTS
jgi:ATP-dependent Lhr-like helicase